VLSSILRICLITVITNTFVFFGNSYISNAEAQQKYRSHPIKEVVLGLGGHDVGVFGHKKERGRDLNIEVRLIPPEIGLWEFIYSPTPHIGVHINGDGNTNQLFLGGNWIFDFGSIFFAGGSLGFAIHDGELDSDTKGRKDLGMQLLFRESVEFGVRFEERHAISIMLDHISNASIDDQNEGLDTVSIRYTSSF
tara:strand:- start:17780 stop:18361 length:582 start_codon:yes stop_codon:yes gene_type:complete